MGGPPPFQNHSGPVMRLYFCMDAADTKADTCSKVVWATHANEGPQSLLRIEMLRTTIKNLTNVLIPQFTESQKSVTVHYPRHLYSVSPPFLIYAVVVQSQILSSHSLSSIPTRQIYLERFFDLVTNSDTVDYSWQIEKLKSWNWGLVTDSQRVTWTAFAILAMFALFCSVNLPFVCLCDDHRLLWLLIPFTCCYLFQFAKVATKLDQQLIGERRWKSETRQSRWRDLSRYYMALVWSISMVVLAVENNVMTSPDCSSVHDCCQDDDQDGD